MFTSLPVDEGNFLFGGTTGSGVGSRFIFGNVVVSTGNARGKREWLYFGPFCRVQSLPGLSAESASAYLRGLCLFVTWPVCVGRSNLIHSALPDGER